MQRKFYFATAILSLMLINAAVAQSGASFVNSSGDTLMQVRDDGRVIIGAALANGNAVLDVDAVNNDKGILIPRLSTAQRTAMSGLAATDEGLLVYDETSGSFWYWSGSQWNELANAGAVNSWGLTGNAGTVDGTNFLGTTDNVALDFRVGNNRALRIEPAGVDKPNIIGGNAFNSVSAGVVGATIGGGGEPTFPNQVTASSGTVSGGRKNTAGGFAATVPGGQQNTAGGSYSFAAGIGANALHDGTFVWADNGTTSFGSTAINQFLIRAGGGVGINKNNPATALDVNGTITATAFVGDGSGLTGISGDNLGNHTATQALNLNSNNITNGGTVTATAFVGDGSGLTGISGEANILTDADNDTRVQVEANPDEDIIHAYIKNVEGLQLNQYGLFAPGVFNNDGGTAPVNGAGVRLMWVPTVAALRVGSVNGNQWNNNNFGRYSSVLGGENNSIPYAGFRSSIAGGANNLIQGSGGFIGAGQDNQVTGEYAGIIGGLYNVASGNHSFIGTGQYNTASGLSSMVAGGEDNNAAGNFSTVAGNGNTAASYGEVTLGLFASNYTPASTTTFDAGDRLFAIGNGADAGSRSNALTVLKNGNVGIGTDQPKQKLHVAGDYYGKGHLWFHAFEGDGSSGTAYVQARDNSGSSSISMQLRTQNAGSIVDAVHLSAAGNVGIATATPGNKLTVNGNADIVGTLGIGTIFPANRLSVIGSADFSGNVGIGTTNPTKAKVEIQGSIDAFLSYGWLNGSGNTGTASGTAGYSLYADQRIAAVEFNAFSDVRIKNILGISNAAEDLQTLMDIEITDYTLIDTVARGAQSHKKVIAQQVEAVFPQAVSTITDVVPDIYKRANIENGWVRLATDLQPGEKVKLISKESNAIYEVQAVREGAFQVDLADSDEVFVYGREVDDFHTVDYEAIAMLNISATQAQQRIIAAQQSELAVLKAQVAAQQSEITALKSENNKLASQNRAFENRFAQIEQALQELNGIKLTSAENR